MALIVVGGNSRSVGKTSVVAGLIAALPEYRWTALKITQFGHSFCSRDGEPCHCATADHSWAISEETEPRGDTDTSRFLAAGAARAWWVRVRQGRLAEAMPAVRDTLAEAENAIVESNSVVSFVQPDLYLMVLDPATADFKRSAQALLDRADALIVHQTKSAPPMWRGVALPAAAQDRIFYIQPPDYVTAQMMELVRGRLVGSPGATVPGKNRVQ
jgi:hypothetical protein